MQILNLGLSVPRRSRDQGLGEKSETNREESKTASEVLLKHPFISHLSSLSGTKFSLNPFLHLLLLAEGSEPGGGWLTTAQKRPTCLITSTNS